MPKNNEIKAFAKRNNVKIINDVGNGGNKCTNKRTSNRIPKCSDIVDDDGGISENGVGQNSPKYEIDGSNIYFSGKYTLWCHDINNKDWGLKSYKKLFEINSVSDFWRVMNNFNKLGIKFNHFFLMKGEVKPIWEHEDNRNGGVCSFKIELNKSAEIFSDLCVKMVCDMLTTTTNFNDINGISISPKNTWAIVKIWNKNSENDLSVTLSPEIITKYSELGIRYKPNAPEY
jgi:hypothetical protein